MKRVGWFRMVLAFAATVTLGILFAATCFPVYAYSGPGMGIYRLEDCVLSRHTKTDRWATSIDEIEPCLRRRPQGKYDLSLELIGPGANASEAIYLFQVNERHAKIVVSQERRWARYASRNDFSLKVGRFPTPDAGPAGPSK